MRHAAEAEAARPRVPGAHNDTAFDDFRDADDLLAGTFVLQALCSNYLLVFSAYSLVICAAIRWREVGPRRTLLITAGALSVAAIFVGFLTFWAARFVYESWKFHDMANGLIVIPLWIPQSSFVLGASLLFIAVLDELVTVARGGKPGYVVAMEERHARGDFTEDV